MLDGLDDAVHLAAEYLLGHAEREALGCRGRDVGGQGEGVAVHHHVNHDGPAGVGECGCQGVAHVAGLLDADAAGAERRGYLAEVRVHEISPERDETSLLLLEVDEIQQAVVLRVDFGPRSGRRSRLEMRILLNAVLDRLPGANLDPGAEDPHIHGLLFRSPPNLPVRLDPA